MVKVSVCMIVRNEAELLARALTSTRGLADELIIVDTGSTDNTIAIAEQFGAQVITGGDRRHKAQERNRALTAATGDWVVILDADEVIADPIDVRAFLETTTAQAIYIKESFMDGAKITLSFHQMRCWRNGTFMYKYRAHEVPLPVNTWGEVCYTPFIWEHRPQGDRSWKREHMLMLLCMDVEENPGDPRPLYYLSREYLYLEAWRACIDITERYLAVAPSESDRAEAYGNLAACYAMLEQPERKVEYLHRAIAEEPQRREWLGLLAEHYHAIGKHTIAIALLRGALELPKPNTGYISENWYGAYIYDLLARCYWYAGEKAKGLAPMQMAVALEPDNQHYRQNLAWFIGDNYDTT